MSQRDLDLYRAVLHKFKGRKCFMIRATNSLRFRIDEAANRGHYIWIDPPWVAFRNGVRIASSDDYSEASFEEWCRSFDSLRETFLESFEESADGALTLVFSQGHRLLVPAVLESDRDDEYDNWYAWDEEKAD